MERGVSFNFLQYLVNVSIKESHGPETLEVRHGLFTVLGTPSPLRIDAPERDVRKHNHRRAAGSPLQVAFQPLKLLAAKFSHSLNLHHIVQAHEVHAFVVEAVPTFAFGPFAIALKVLLAIVDVRVMLAGHVMDLLGLGFLKELLNGIELFGLGGVREIAGVDQELGRFRQGVDLIDGGLKSAAYVRICRLVETNVTV